MSIRNLITAASIALLPLAASAATLIVPAAGTGPGANNSVWKSELTLHNVSSSAISVQLQFVDPAGDVVTKPQTVGARATVVIDDVVRTTFGRESGIGALRVIVPDAAATKLAVASRTFNVSPAGELGQDIPAVRTEDALQAGDTGVLAGPASASGSRFNFGLYTVTAATIRWELVRADGTLAASKDETYAAGSSRQYNAGVVTYLEASAQDGDSIHASLKDGSAIVYGSAVNQLSGDPTFVPAFRTRPDISIDFIGVDLNEDGTVEAVDANHDGVIDSAVDMFTSFYPNYFRIVAKGPNGEPLTFTIIAPQQDIVMADANGTIQWAPSSKLKGTTGTLHVRATDGIHTADLFIPVNYR
jgi:hypothetical protein